MFANSRVKKISPTPLSRSFTVFVSRLVYSLLWSNVCIWDEADGKGSFFLTFKHSILQVFLHHLWSKRFSFPMVTLLKMHQLTRHGSISRLYPVLWYTLVSPHRSILAAKRQVLKVLQLFSLLQGCPTPHLHRLTAIPAIFWEPEKLNLKFL